MAKRLRRLHVFRSALALALVAGFLATPLGIAHAGRLAHDLCDAGDVRQDPAAARMGSAAAQERHGHCFTCHWFQSLRTALVAVCIAVPQADAVSLVRFESPWFIPASASTAAGARAPPA